jgi:elongation factor P
MKWWREARFGMFVHWGLYSGLAGTWEGKPVGVNLPRTMEFKVASTEPRLQGATKTALYKPAVIETGATVQVPEFIKEGDVIRVDTQDDKYLSRA